MSVGHSNLADKVDIGFSSLLGRRQSKSQSYGKVNLFRYFLCKVTVMMFDSHAVFKENFCY